MRRSRSVPSCAPGEGRADDESLGRSGERPPRGGLGSSRVICVRETSLRKIGGTWSQPKGYANFASLQRNARDARYYRLFRLWYIHMVVRA